MEVFLHESAEKFLGKLDRKTQLFIKEHIKKLSSDPYSKHLDVKKLKGLQNKQDVFRLRAGDYRIVYFLQEERIWITEILKREKGYNF